MKKQDKRQGEGGGQWLNAMCVLLKGGVLAGLSAMVSLLLCAVLVSAGVLRERWMEGMVLAVCVLGSLIGGGYALRKIKGYGLLAGLGVGGVLFLLLLMAGLLAFETTTIERGGGILCACLCGGGMAGILFRGRPKKKRRR